MINYSNLSFKRAIIHTIHPKAKKRDAYVTYDEQLFVIDNNIKKILTDRLTDAAGKDSRAFELEVGNAGADSFFSNCYNLNNLNDADFISKSKWIADKLAASQTRPQIPGGYIIILDCFDISDRKNVYIIIKAEAHEALIRKNAEVNALSNVFLSPAMKLFKIGILYEKEINAGCDPLKYGCFLFDENFRPEENAPASYFYDRFLGFSVSKNAKITTSRFYDFTIDFIHTYTEDFECRLNLENALNAEMISNQSPLFTPNDFANSYLPDQLKDEFSCQSGRTFPTSFVKDTTLLKSKLSTKKITFPHNIRITGPNDNFDQRIEFFNDHDVFAERLTQEDMNNFTIVLIAGKPL